MNSGPLKRVTSSCSTSDTCCVNLLPILICSLAIRVLLAGDPKECGDDKTTQDCEPPSPLSEECVDCVYKDEEYRFGDLLEIQDNGCVKW